MCTSTLSANDMSCFFGVAGGGGHGMVGDIVLLLLIPSSPLGE